MISWTEAGVDWEAEKDPRPRRLARGQGRGLPARPPQPRLLVNSRPISPFLPWPPLGRIALAVPSPQVASFLEFSLTLTLPDPFTSVFPAFTWLVAPPGASSPPEAWLPLLVLLTVAETPLPSGSPHSPVLDCLPCSAHSPCPLPKELALSCSVLHPQGLGQGLAHSRCLENE